MEIALATGSHRSRPAACLSSDLPRDERIGHPFALGVSRFSSRASTKAGKCARAPAPHRDPSLVDTDWGVAVFDRLRERWGRKPARGPEPGPEHMPQISPGTHGAPIPRRRDAEGQAQKPLAERPPAPAQVPSPFDGPRFAVIDVETTGLSASSDRILEIAIVTTDASGSVLDSWVTRLNPDGPVGATHIHGITAADVRNAPRFADMVPELNRRLRGAAFAAHNARFDLAFLRAEYARAGWRMPFVPALCTLEASTHYLADLPRRRLTDVCEALGVPPFRAHSALHDATATATIVAAFMHPQRPPRRVDTDLPGDGWLVAWPSSQEDVPVRLPSSSLSGRARQNIAARAVAPPAQPLVQLIDRFSLVDALGEGAPPGTVAYLEKLADALQDGVLDPREQQGLREMAATYELTDADVATAHRAFVAALAYEAMADSKLSRQERAELSAVSTALGVPAKIVTGSLAAATREHQRRHAAKLRPLPSPWTHGEPLRVGDHVVITGCEDAGRDNLEKASEKAGVRIMNAVTRKTAMLVRDDDSDGVKSRRATELGTRIVTPGEYGLLLKHLQPSLPVQPMPVSEPGSTSAEVVSKAPLGYVLASDGPELCSLAAPSAVEPSAAELRAWGVANGWVLGKRGRLPAELREAYLADRGPAETPIESV